MSDVEPDKRPVVLLDFDGVLVPWRGAPGSRQELGRICRRAVDALNRITESTDAALVVSSSWRLRYSLSRLVGVLDSAGVVAPVIGATSDIGDRAREINYWLSRHQARPFAVLDDDREGELRSLSAFLVRPRLALNDADADAAIRILEGQPKGRDI